MVLLLTPNSAVHINLRGPWELILDPTGNRILLDHSGECGMAVLFDPFQEEPEGTPLAKHEIRCRRVYEAIVEGLRAVLALEQLPAFYVLDLRDIINEAADDHLKLVALHKKDS